MARTLASTILERDVVGVGVGVGAIFITHSLKKNSSHLLARSAPMHGRFRYLTTIDVMILEQHEPIWSSSCSKLSTDRFSEMLLATVMVSSPRLGFRDVVSRQLGLHVDGDFPWRGIGLLCK